MVKWLIIAATAVLVVSGIAAYLLGDRWEVNKKAASVDSIDMASGVQSSKAAGGKSDLPISQRVDQPSATSRSNRALEKFLTMKSLAEAGDSVAQREFAEAYARCIYVNQSPQRFFDSVDAIAKQSKSPSNAAAMRRNARAMADGCAVVDNGAFIPIEARDLWLEQAAKNGNLAARAELYMSALKWPQGEELQGFMDAVVEGRDPAAIFKLGELVSGNPGEDSVGQYTGLAAGELSGYAWSIVACRMGLDCGANSQIMMAVCLNTTGCSSPDFESFVRDNMVSAGDAVLLNSKIEDVSKLLSK